MQKNKILITGGLGYIGSHTCVNLLEKDFDCIIVDNLVNSNISVLDGIEKIIGKKPSFEKVDCIDFESLRKVFEKNSDINGIIHFAALKAVGESVNFPLKYYRNNIDSLLNVLNLMEEFHIQNFVFSSSATVYGEPDILPVNEETCLKPATSPYGWTKVMAENIIKDYLKSNKNAFSIVLRYFNPIGAHSSGLIGELPNGVPQNLLPYITQTAIGIREKLGIFGNDYKTKDGFCVRDYIDVNDLADAHISAISRMINKNMDNNLEIFNIGTGKGLSVMELVKKFEEANNLKLNYEIKDRRQGDVPEIWADCSKANKVLNWKAKKTIEETLISAWNWQKKLQTT